MKKCLLALMWALVLAVSACGGGDVSDPNTEYNAAAEKALAQPTQREHAQLCEFGCGAGVYTYGMSGVEVLFTIDIMNGDMMFIERVTLNDNYMAPSGGWSAISNAEATSVAISFGSQSGPTAPSFGVIGGVNSAGTGITVTDSRGVTSTIPFSSMPRSGNTYFWNVKRWMITGGDW